MSEDNIEQGEGLYARIIRMQKEHDEWVKTQPKLKYTQLTSEPYRKVVFVCGPKTYEHLDKELKRIFKKKP